MSIIILSNAGAGVESSFEVACSQAADGAVDGQPDASAPARSSVHWRALFIAEAGRLLNSSLDYTATLEAVARAVVPALADYCLVDLLEPDGAVQRLAAVHRDPAKEKLMDDMRRVHRPHVSEPGIVMHVLRDGRPLLHEQVTDADLVAASRGPEHLEMLRALTPQSRVTAPLIARSRILGAISLVYAESGRRYAREDIDVAMDLAQRAAVAIDNARLYREAQDANAAKDRFLAQLSHELRTPLTPALLLAQACAARSDLPAEVRDDAEVIRRNLELEARLIDDLLDLTRVVSGKLIIEPAVIDAHQAAVRACDVCRPEMHAKALRFSLDLTADEHHVEADAGRLQQVLWNLLKNAAKFTPHGGSIVVRSSNPRAGLLRFEVQDTGPGIEPEAMARIFKPFEQASEAVTRQFGGLGLGLAISKALVDMHRGVIRVHSDGPGRGATFVVELRAWSNEAAKEDGAIERGTQHANPRAHQHPGLRILLVEDHDDTLRLMARLLEGLGHRVTQASDVSDAMNAADAGTFDLVISDLGLPDGSGLHLMQHLHRQWQLPGIALSGFGMEEDVRRSIDAGFVEHLTKPIDIDMLLAAIKRVGRCRD